MADYYDLARQAQQQQIALPRKQRILAPSTVEVAESDMGSRNCVCSLRIIDPVNLHVYYVPMTPQMVTAIRTGLAQHDPAHIRAEQLREADPS